MCYIYVHDIYQYILICHILMLGMLCQWFIRSMVQLLHQIKIQITVILSHSLKLTHPDNTTSLCC